jgi:hypothetical protein
MGLEHKKYRDLDINLVDTGLRNLIVLMNKLPFLETIGCCEGHSYNNTKHTEGYIQGIMHNKDKYEIFNKEFQKFIHKKNKSRPQIVDITKYPNFYIIYLPDKKENLSTNLMTDENYLYTSHEEGKRVINERQILWNDLEIFLKDYINNE